VPALPLFAAVGLVVCAPVMSPAPAGTQEDQVSTYSYTRIYADERGESHFSDEELILDPITPAPGIPPTPASSPMPAIGMRVFCPPAGGDADWHPVPGRVFNMTISGQIEIEVSSGEVRRFGPGSLILGEDTVGRGHRTRVVGTERACFAMVMLPQAESGD
jgi:hypothetical protein